MSDLLTISIGIVSFLIASISLYLTLKSIKTSIQSIDTLKKVRNEIEEEFQRVKSTNSETQELISRLTKLFDSSEKHGLEMVYPDRMTALNEFKRFLDEESNEEVIVIGSSLLGLFLYINGFEDIIKRNPKNYKFILTHPDFSHLREGPEGRGTKGKVVPKNVIKGEICEYINKVINCGVPEKNIQLYKGAPTVFTIITKNHMLLNPYPYGTEAYRTFCIQIRDNSTIYKQYREKHFEKIFDSEWIETCEDYLKKCNGDDLKSIEVKQ